MSIVHQAEDRGGKVHWSRGCVQKRIDLGLAWAGLGWLGFEQQPLSH